MRLLFLLNDNLKQGEQMKKILEWEEWDNIGCDKIPSRC